jgi:multidrug resistance efflux pump
MLQRYERHRHDAETALRQAMQELATTGQVSDATLRAVSVPGQPLPRAALDALVTLQQDAVRFDSLVQKLTTGLAITRLTWECHDLHDQLAASTEANQELTDEQRRLLEKRLEGLQRDLQQVIAKKEVLERHLQPALDALLTEYTAVQDSATRAGLRAPGLGTPVMPYRTQAPAGYGR